MPPTSTCSASTTRCTSPRLPLSRPAMTITLSPFLILRMSEHLRGERDDFHEALGPQLARDRPENPRADGLELGVEEHRRIGVELEERPVVATHALRGAHYHGVVELAFFDATARRGVLDAHLDHVPDVRIAALGPAKHLDAHHAP